ncbi:MAG: cbb3-type cytochrome c oxidase subunit I [Gluconacetobacter diazotrophicus]|nr:cbb3-type cytochrome c oxidase subunit I [Gluconacetobacter diazotrophicus]
MFLLSATLAGLAAGASSLLFMLPSDRSAALGAPALLLAAGHPALMLLGCAVPAMLGGMGFLLVPGAIGAPDCAFPRLSRFAAASALVGIACFLFGLLSGRVAVLGAAVGSWTLGLVLASAVLLATLLNHRAPSCRVRDGLFPRTIAIAAFLAACALPVICADCLLSGRHDAVVVLRDLSDRLAWPCLLLLSVPAIGLAADVVSGDRPAAEHPSRVTSRPLLAGLLGFQAGVGFLLWCGPLFGHPGSAVLSRGILLLPPAVALLLIGRDAVRGGFLGRIGRPAELHVAGFLLVALASVVWTLLMHLPTHYLLSAGSAFILLSGLHVWLGGAAARPVPVILSRCQFGFLFVGIHLMLLPSVTADSLGAACCALALLLLPVLLGATLSRSHASLVAASPR